MRHSYLIAIVIAGCGFGDNQLRAARATCGDRVVDPGEGCDDGNLLDHDGCSQACAVETVAPACGNGSREVGEACDDGNLETGDGCSTGCEREAICGDGVREAPETCDDGNTRPGDGCSGACTDEQAACTLVPQTGCPVGEACDFDATGEIGCRDVTLASTADTGCATLDECAPGFTCRLEDRVCVKLCTGDAQCGTGERCLVELDAAGQTIAHGCTNRCDPVAQSGCPNGTACHATEDGATDVTECLAAGTLPISAPCEHDTQCVAGGFCSRFSAADVARCGRYCAVGISSTCPAHQTCFPFATPLVVDGVQLGGCA